MKVDFYPIALVALILVLLAIMALPATGQIEDVTNFNGIHLVNSTFGTATPALMIDQQGSTSNNILEIRDASTPVFIIKNGGNVGNARVLAYPTPGVGMRCGTNTITDTVTYASTVTAISTPVWGQCSLQAITGDASRCAIITANGSTTITVRNSAATPAANSAGAVVNWCVGGTPQ